MRHEPGRFQCQAPHVNPILLLEEAKAGRKQYLWFGGVANPKYSALPTDTLQSSERGC